MFRSAESEHPRLTNGEIISEEFFNLCDHNPSTLQTDGQTDRQTTCDRKTALCTKVHRAVKIEGWPMSKGDEGMRGGSRGTRRVPFPLQ